MIGFLSALLAVFLVFISLFLIFIILMQRTGSGSGMGAAMGGGSVESALGPATGNVLTRGTVYATVIFFAVAFILYLLTLSRATPLVDNGPSLPEISLTDLPEASIEVDPEQTTQTQD